MGDVRLKCLMLGPLLAGSLSVSAGSTGLSGAELAAVRKNVRVSEAIERRLRADFKALELSGEVSPKELRAYRDYLNRISQIVEQERQLLERLLADRHLRAASTTMETDLASTPAVSSQRGAEQTDGEMLSDLDGELDTSLREFDDKLLREMQLLSEEQAHTGDMTSGREGIAAGGARRQPAEASASGTDSAEGGWLPVTPEASGTSELGGESGTAASASVSRDPSGKGQGSDGVVAPDIPDGKDDDVVARQLREAAENEPDPELRAKLWEEYKAYKKNGS